MPKYSTTKIMWAMPRLPRSGVLDLTYRCNNNCRHCWISIPPVVSQVEPPGTDSPSIEGRGAEQCELSSDEIRDVVDQARAMGCREWRITGGEPMLRPDFAEIFDYITRKATRYTLNTNGTLITPQIAQLMRRKGRNLVAVYGATAEVHDHVTRTPGSFERTMRGFAYLKEADANFEVQLIPMRDNFHQWDEMQVLAQSLSKRWRCGAAWLYLSACGDPERNREIKRQRLDPKDVVKLSPPNLSSAEWWAAGADDPHVTGFGKPVTCEGDDRLLAACIGGRRRSFHVDPYGQMTFCIFIKDPALRYDLRQGSFEEAWNVFIPSLADRVRGGQEYLENCAVCELRSSCEWCCIYAYLEHRRFSAPVGYLCDVARENRRFEEDWEKRHRRYYECAGITFRAESDLPVTDASFHPTLNLFQVDRPEEATISIRHYSGFPNLESQDPGEEVCRMGDWRVHKKDRSWIYLRTVSEEDGTRSRRMIGNAGQSIEFGGARIERLAVFNHDHTRARVFGDLDSPGRLHSFRSDYSFLTLAALAQVLADRGGGFIHSSGAIMDGHGLLFMGHSEAGKSTIRGMLKDKAGVEILGDDRNVIGRWPDGYRVHGVWGSIDPEDVSAASAPLRAILWLEQAPENRLIPLGDRMEVVQKLLACLVKPMATAEWWDKSLTVLQGVAREVPCYTLRFDLSGGVVKVLRRFCEEKGEA